MLTVSLLLPRVLADSAAGQRQLTITTAGCTVRAVLDSVAVSHPLLHRRLRDEAGALRRYVNVYVDGLDIRRADGIDTKVTTGAEVTVLPSVAGG